MRPNFQFLSRFFVNSLTSISTVKADEAVEEEFNENDENEKHSNTVYV